MMRTKKKKTKKKKTNTFLIKSRQTTFYIHVFNVYINSQRKKKLWKKLHNEQELFTFSFYKAFVLCITVKKKDIILYKCEENK